jgi:hypothetical protein
MAKQKSSSINPELIKRMALLADSMLKSGVGDQDVHAALMKQGVSPESAATIIRTLRKSGIEKLRKQSQRDLRIGAVVLVIGLLASILLGAGVIVEPSGYALLVTFCVMIIAGVLLGRAIMDQRTVKQAETKQG